MDGVNLPTCLFFLFAAVACAAAVAVLLVERIVYMAVALLFSLGAVAGLFFLAGANFLGLVQLMVYVGGTVVLLAFGVMLTARRGQRNWTVGPAQWSLGLLVGGCLLATLLWATVRVPEWRSVPPGPVAGKTEIPTGTVNAIGWAVLGLRLDQQAQADPIARAGMSGYLLPFEIISVHLVLVLVGAAFLARAKRPRISQHAPLMSAQGASHHVLPSEELPQGGSS